MNFRTQIIQHLVHINEKLVFYPRLRRFYCSKFSGNPVTVIDVGVNKGQSIDFFRNICSTAVIYGFEPNEKLYKRLLSKYRNVKEVHIFNKGISSRPGSLIFNENVMDETSTFEQLNYESAYLKQKARILGVAKENLIAERYEVEVTTLDIFLKQYPDTFFDVLKIDVEGHEFHSLNGLFAGSGGRYPIRFIQIESHNDDMYLRANPPAEIDALLQANGFNKVMRIKHGFGDFHEIIYENRNL